MSVAERGAYLREQAEYRLRAAKINATLVLSLMPVGVVLDWQVYPSRVPLFFVFRLVCAALAGVLYLVLRTAWGARNCRWLEVVPPVLPITFISAMIAVEDGFNSPYYAGLNLVLLAISMVAHWTLWETLGHSIFAILCYTVAGAFHGPLDEFRIPVNNYYFLSLTGVIATISAYYGERLRQQEFLSRHQVEQGRALLEATNRELEGVNLRQKEMNIRLEENNKKLMELDEAKSRFFANISHELRTPLTLLIAPLEVLINRRQRLTESQVKEHLHTMETNGLRLLKLINDLLDLVRLDSGRMEVHADTVALPEFLGGVLNSTRVAADERRIRLQLQVGTGIGRVVFDRDKIEKVLLNLLFNALKFTPSGGQITLDAAREEQQLVLSVRDTGKGIPLDQVGNIFDRFWQADTSARRKYQGVGIGLALVKELIEVQGGTVQVDSTVGQGTSMTCRIPWREPAGAEALPAVTEEADAAAGVAAHPVPASAEDTGWISALYRRAELFPAIPSIRDSMRPMEVSLPGKRPRVLVADDEPDMLRFLKSQLEMMFEIIEAVDGLQAIEKAAQFLPDAILCDMMMPERDGIQVCRELRGRIATQNIPIVLLTARADEATKIEALTAGASDFLTKPFSTSELHVRLQNLVLLHRSRRDLTDQKRKLESTLEELKDTEVQLVQAEKLGGLGRMSAGIIHEINNPLNYARTGLHFLGQLARRIPEAQRTDFADTIRDVEEGLGRVSKIISDLRAFSHPNAGEGEQVPVKECIDSSLRFLTHEWRDRVRIVVDVPDSFRIFIDRNRFIQVLVNMLQNAFDALRTKAFMNGSGPEIRLSSETINGESILHIRDNGSGIPAGVVDKVFDPFFTTKEVGQGTGLGLSICHRIVRDAGGRILVDSRPGEYTEFRLEFPSTAAAN